MEALTRHAPFPHDIQVPSLDFESWDPPSFFGFVPHRPTAILNVVVQKGILKWEES
jgi:hypothetical protein